MTRPRLIIFTRYPEPGKVKTRLIPALGAEGAAAVHRQLAAHTLRWASEFSASGDIHVEVRFDGGNLEAMRRLFGSCLDYQPQGPGDLGSRLDRAIRESVAAGAPTTIVVGTDCPQLDRRHVEATIKKLTAVDLVLGPALDGGYYLIGVRQAYPALFSEIAWGTSEVFQQTREAAAELGLSVALLEPLADVDRPADLSVWEAVRDSASSTVTPALISVVIPTFNEELALPDTMVSLAGEPQVETIVADADSQDRTAEIARSCGARVCTTPRGRARQMNAGAALARGEILLFLHADTRLPRGFASEVRRALADPGVSGGAFELAIDDSRRVMRLIERAANFRSRWLGLPYGDQAIFVRTSLFHALGGLADLPIMEDVDLVRRLRKHGRLHIIRSPVVTSARRWRTGGILRTTALHQVLLAAYLFGIPPARLARWRGHGSPPPSRER